MLGVVYIMVLFGLIMILSASSIRAFAGTGDSYYYIKKQFLWMIVGSVALFVFSRIPVHRLQQLTKPALYCVAALLVGVLIPSIGHEVDGSSRWIPIGGFRLQPSEFAKFAIILYTADFLAKKKGKIKDIQELFSPYGLIVGAFVVLVMLQPDLGTTLTMCLGAFTLLFISGLELRMIAVIGIAGAIVGAFSILSRDYQLKRFTAFLNPNADPLGAGYHIRQSLIAFGSGGLFGVGLSMSRQKYFYLPAAHTDFIFAIIGEELGLIGTVFTVGLFTVFAYYGIRIAFQSKNTFSRYLGAGITSMIALQALVNMGAVTAVLPVTGIPMPFISYGGSSLMVNLACVGILLSIALENERTTRGRRSKPELHIVGDSHDLEDEHVAKRRTRAKKRSSSSSATRGKPKKSSSTNKRGKASSASTSRDSRSTSTSRSKSGTIETKQTGRTKSHASSNKRRRDSGSRVSRPSPRQSTSKNKK
jgi:cell division protein FtsW